MIRIGLIALALSALAQPALAGPGKGDHAQRLAHVAERLGLDDTQREQFAEVMREQREKAHEMRRSMREQGIERGSDQARAQHEAMKAQTQERLSGILNPEQLEELRAMHEQRKQKRRQHRERHRHGGERDTL